MSIFSKLDKKDRRQVFSGKAVPGDRIPAGDILPDGTVLANTKEGWNTFRMVSCPRGKAVYGAASRWACDLSLKNSQRLGERILNG